MGKTYRRDSGFRPKNGRGFKDFKQSRKFREQEFEKFGRIIKKPLDESLPEVENRDYE